jgi:hypothetical protein
VWTETRLRALGSLSTYDLAPDGKRLAAFLADNDANGNKGPNALAPWADTNS